MEGIAFVHLAPNRSLGIVGSLVCSGFYEMPVKSYILSEGECKDKFNLNIGDGFTGDETKVRFKVDVLSKTSILVRAYREHNDDESEDDIVPFSVHDADLEEIAQSYLK